MVWHGAPITLCEDATVWIECAYRCCVKVCAVDGMVREGSVCVNVCMHVFVCEKDTAAHDIVAKDINREGDDIVCACARAFFFCVCVCVNVGMEQRRSTCGTNRSAVSCLTGALALAFAWTTTTLRLCPSSSTISSLPLMR